MVEGKKPGRREGGCFAHFRSVSEGEKPQFLHSPRTEKGGVKILTCGKKKKGRPSLTGKERGKGKVTDAFTNAWKERWVLERGNSISLVEENSSRPSTTLLSIRGWGL